MRLTTNHPQSSYGIPIFVDSKNNPIDYGLAIKMLRQKHNISTQDFANKLGVSHRSVENWEQNHRQLTKQILLSIKAIYRL